MNNKREALGGWQELMMTSGQKGRRGYSQQDHTTNLAVRIRVRIIWVFCIALLSTLVARVVYLQVFESGQQLLLSQANHIELARDPAPRGIIYDRQNIPLVNNIKVEDDYVREYPLGPAGAPILGYISEVNQGEIGCENGLCYSPKMMIGRAGIEKEFENTLRGRDGGTLKEVDAKGVTVRDLGQNESEAGSDVYLSIDSRLQKVMYRALGGRKGSAVAMDMQGKVLGLVSSPAYDPNLFGTSPDSAKLSKQLTDEKEHYFLDRAIAGTYPPGSVFKLVTAYAGLLSGDVTNTTKIDDTGEIRIGEYRYGNWYFDQYGRKEGEIDLIKAIARSNDIFFYKIGEEIGVDQLVSMAKKFGLGEPTGIELPGSEEGLVPDRLWKERVTGEKWFLGNTYHLSIGQGDLLVTPAQIARMTGAAVSGRLCKLSLLKVGTADCRDLGIPTDQLSMIHEGMRQACASGGTAYPFFSFSPYVLCKTGTAQHSGQKTEEDKPHAWITVAYPGENPKMILTVMLEAAGEGSEMAAPVAKEILTEWRNLGE